MERIQNIYHNYLDAWNLGIVGKLESLIAPKNLSDREIAEKFKGKEVFVYFPPVTKLVQFTGCAPKCLLSLSCDKKL